MTNIYVANLGKYNEGVLKGEWIELPVEIEEIEDLFCEIGLGSRDKDENYIHGLEKNGVFYEEYAIHDFDTDIDGLNIQEYSNIYKLNELLQEIEESEIEINILNAISEVTGYDINQCIDIYNDGDYSIIHNAKNYCELGIEYINETCGSIEEISVEDKRYYLDDEQLGLYLRTSVEWFANTFEIENMSDKEIADFFLSEFDINDLSIEQLEINFDYESYAKDKLNDFSFVAGNAISVY